MNRISDQISKNPYDDKNVKDVEQVNRFGRKMSDTSKRSLSFMGSHHPTVQPKNKNLNSNSKSIIIAKSESVDLSSED